SKAGVFQVCEYLGFMNGKNAVHRLELDHHAVLDDDIRSISCWHLNALVRHFDCNLGCGTKPIELELPQKAGPVTALQQSGAQNLVHFYSAAQYLSRNRIMIHHALHGSSTVEP